MLTKEIVIRGRELAWEGKKISEIAKILNCSQSNLYQAIKGETWSEIKNPKPFNKKELTVFTCTECKEVLTIDQIGHGKICRICRNIYKSTLPKNKLSEQKRNKTQREKDPNKWKEYQKNYQLINKEKLQKQHKFYYEKNKQLIYEKSRIRNKNPYNMLIRRMRKALRRCLNKNLYGKFRYLPYSKNELVDHLLSTLPENLKITDCHIDHIRPICSFDINELMNPNSAQFLECWALNNLRLISASDNLKKSFKYDPKFTEI